MKSRSRLERRSLNWSRSMAREHRAEDLRPEDVRERVVAVFGEPEQQLAAGGVLADEPGQGFLEQFDLAFVNEQAGQLAAELGGNAV